MNDAPFLMEQRRRVYILGVLRVDEARFPVSNKMKNVFYVEKKTVLSDGLNCFSSSRGLSPKVSVNGDRMDAPNALREAATMKDSSVA